MQSHVCWKTEFAVLADRFDSRDAVVADDGVYSFAELFAAAGGVAARLLGLSAAAGTPVAWRLPNSRAAVAASYGITLAGATEVPINPSVSPDEARVCIEAAGAAVVVGDRYSAVELGIDAARIIDIATVVPCPLANLPLRPVPAQAWGKILFTSGTTGKPKAIVHSQLGRWLANLLMRATLPRSPVPGERLLLLAPFAHGASLMTYAFLDGGASVELPEQIDPAHAAERLASGEIASVMASPTVLAKLVDVLQGKKVDGVRVIYCGTAPLSPALYLRVRAIFGPVVRIAYGQSEIFNPIATLAPQETDRYYSEALTAGECCVGWPASGVEIRVNADGAVLVRSPHMLAGMITDGAFWPHPPEAFHRTGDIGRIDRHGRLVLQARESDVIKTGGYRVAPNEVEAILRPFVRAGEIAVFGVPSEHWGEIIAVAGAGVEPDWIAQLPISTMTAYKRPRLFVCVPALPVNALGKLMRSRLLETTLQRYRLLDGAYPSLAPHEAETSPAGEEAN